MNRDEFCNFLETHKCISYFNPYHDIAGNNSEKYIFELEPGKYYSIEVASGPYAKDGFETFGPTEIDVIKCGDTIYEKERWMK